MKNCKPIGAFIRTCDGERRHNHPLQFISSSDASLLSIDSILQDLTRANDGSFSTSDVHRVIQQRAYYFENMAAASSTADTLRYNSLTYLADAFIPLLVASQKQKDSMRESTLRELAPDIDHKVFHEGDLPNICHIVIHCCFWGTTKASRNALIHILTKALPLRCQSRSMQNIILTKAEEEDPSILDFIITIFLCFAFGGYGALRRRPSLEVRAHMYDFFFLSDNARQDMERWMHENTEIRQLNKNGNIQKKVKYHHENTVTLAIRAFVCVSVKQLPNLYAVLADSCHWKEFEAGTYHLMEEVMAMMSENYTNRRELFDGVEAHIESIKKSRKTKIYTPSKGSFLSQMLTKLNKYESSMRSAEGNHLRKHASGESILINRDRVGAMLCLWKQTAINTLKITSRLPQTHPELDELIKDNSFPLGVTGMSDTAVRAVEVAQQNFMVNEKPKFLNQLLKTLAELPYDFELFSEFLRQHHIHDNVRLYTLPLHYIEQQLLVLIRNHGDSSDLNTLIKDHATISVCLHCGTVHSFIVTPDRAINQTAFGNHGVIVDDEELKIYCAGKKSSPNSGSDEITNVQLDSFSPIEMNALIKKMKARRAKQEKASYQKKICNACEITRFNLLGGILMFFKELYLLCCNCGSKTVYGGGRFYDNRFVCGCCLDRNIQELVECDLCTFNDSASRQKFWTIYEDILDDVSQKECNTVRDLRVCKKCNKRWLQVAYKKFKECGHLEPIAPQLTLEIMTRGNREKWSVSRGIIITKPKTTRGM